MSTTRRITAGIRDSGPFTPHLITGPTAVIYDILADGDWHEEDEILAATARAVPPAKGLRRRIGKDATPPTGLAYVRATAAGQRKIASNLLMIAVRGCRVEQHPDSPNLFRASTGIVDAWTAHRKVNP